MNNNNKLCLTLIVIELMTLGYLIYDEMVANPQRRASGESLERGRANLGRYIQDRTTR